MTRTKSIEVVVDEEEEREIKAAAKRASLTTSSFLRQIAIAAARKTAPKQRAA